MRRMIPVVLLATVFAGCAYHAPSEPSPTSTTATTPTASSIRVTAASRLDQQLDVVATVLASDGRLVPNVAVTFTATAGTFTAATVVTSDGNGAARTILANAGIAVVNASAGAIQSSVNVLGPIPTPAPTPGGTTPTPTPTPTPTTPTAIMNVASTGTTGASIAFGVSAPALGQTWSWSFGDGAAAQTTTFSTTHVYAAAGTYTATVSAAGVNSGRATITISDPAVVVQPAAVLIPTLTCTAGTLTVATFCNVSATDETGAAVPPLALSVDWNWGDASTPETAVSAVRGHAYTQVGTYVVRVSASASGRYGSTTQTVVIK